MITKVVKIVNPTGLQMQAAGDFCQVANGFSSKITFVYKKNNTANAKSVLSVLGASVKMGEEIELCCEGEDEEEAMNRLSELVENGFQS